MILLYCFKSFVLSAFVVTMYIALLQYIKLYAFSRFFLLLGVVLSLLIPLSYYTNTIVIHEADLPTLEKSIESTDAIVHNENYVIKNGKPTFNYWLIMLVGYTLITTFFLIQFCRNIYQFYKVIKNSEIVKVGKFSYTLQNENIVPYTFLQYIFVSKTAYYNNEINELILKHEQAHVIQKHTIDIIFIELARIFFWFNPFLYAIKKCMQLNHELLADEAAISSTNSISYQQLLLQQIQQTQLPFSSSFNYLFTKKRFQLMQLSAPSIIKSICMKTLISIATAVCIFLSIEKKVVAQVIPLKSNKIEKLDKGTSAKGKITKEKIELPPFDEATASAELKEFLKIIRSHRTITAMPNEDTMYRYKVPYNDRVVLTKLFEKIEKPERKYMQYFIWAIIRDYTSEPPTKEQFERYKNPKLYGVWLNDKRVANTELKKYNYSDFANAFASKLYGAAKKGRNYSVQVNMETNEYYKAQQNNRNKKSERDMWTTIKKGTTTNQLL